jgi:hypothetical protein
MGLSTAPMRSLNQGVAVLLLCSAVAVVFGGDVVVLGEGRRPLPHHAPRRCDGSLVMIMVTLLFVVVGEVGVSTERLEHAKTGAPCCEVQHSQASLQPQLVTTSKGSWEVPWALLDPGS